MKARLLLIFPVFLFTLGSVSVAEVRIFRKEVREVISGALSKEDARISAIARAKREALEEAGTFLETLTVVRNAQVEKDEIIALSSGVLRTKIIEESVYVDKGVSGLHIVVEVQVDTSILTKRIQEFSSDRKNLKRLKESELRIGQLLTRIEQLKLENARLLESADLETINLLKKKFKEASQRLIAQDWFKKGLALWKHDKFDPAERAIEYFTVTIQMDPNFSFAYAMRGWAFFEQRKFNQAINDYNHAIRLNPNIPEGYALRGVIFYEMKELARAIENYTKVISFNHTDGGTFFVRGIAYLELEKIHQAIEDFNRAIQFGPITADMYIYRGTAHAYQKNFEMSLQDLTQAIKINPSNFIPYVNRGNVYNLLHKYRQAIQDFKQAIRLEGGNATTYKNLGGSYFHLKQYTSAIESYNEAIRLNPGYAKAYRDRGISNYKLKILTAACDDWRKASELGDAVAGDLLTRKC